MSQVPENTGFRLCGSSSDAGSHWFESGAAHSTGGTISDDVGAR